MGNIIHDRVNSARKLKEWTWDQLYKEYENKYFTNIENTIGGWKKGATPGFDKIIQIADILDCDTDYLAGLQECPRKTEALLEEKTGINKETWGKILAVTENNQELKSIIADFLFSGLGNHSYTNINGISGLLNGIFDLIKLNIPPRIDFCYGVDLANYHEGNTIPEFNSNELYNIFFNRLISDLDLFIRQQREKHCDSYSYGDEYERLEKLINDKENELTLRTKTQQRNK